MCAVLEMNQSCFCQSFLSHSSLSGEATEVLRELRLLNEMSGKPAEGLWAILFFTGKRKEILRKNFYSSFHHSLLSFESDCHSWSCKSQLETTSKYGGMDR